MTHTSLTDCLLYLYSAILLDALCSASICCRNNNVILKRLWNIKDQSVRGLHTNLCVIWDSRSHFNSFYGKKRRPLLYGKTLSRRKLYIKLYLYPRIDVKFIYKQAVSVGEIYNLKLCRLTSNFVNKVQYGLSLLGKNYGQIYSMLEWPAEISGI